MAASSEGRDDDADALSRRSDAFIEAENFGPQTLQVNQRLIVIHPKNALYWSRVGSCFKAAGELEKARRAFGCAQG